MIDWLQEAMSKVKSTDEIKSVAYVRFPYGFMYQLPELKSISSVFPLEINYGKVTGHQINSIPIPATYSYR